MANEVDPNVSVPAPAAPQAPLPAPTVAPTKLKEIAGFEIIGKLGQGGMGAVFKARQKSLDRIVALKVLPPSVAKDAKFTDRFQREARASAKLNHPNIVQGIDVGRDATTGLWYFAMEFVDGPTLKKILDEQKVMPEERALAIIKEVAKALETIGQHQMVHRDIKPDNILLTQRGEAKLADLGLARQLNEDASITQSGQTVGTPHYMAPEQVRGKFEECDIRTDIYSLGATLFHLVVGHPPFSGETSAVIMSKHLTEPAPKASKANPAVTEPCSRLIERMMQKKIDQRVQSPADVVTQIEKIQNGEATSGHRAVHRTTGPRSPVGERDGEAGEATEKKSPVLLYAGAGVAALVVLMLVLKGSGTPEKTGPVVDNTKQPVKNPGSGEQSVEMKGPDKKNPPNGTGDTTKVIKQPAVSPEELFKAAQEFDQKNPDSWDDIAQRYRRAAQAAKGSPQETEFQEKADDAVAAMQNRQRAAADKAWAAAEERSTGLTAIGNYDEAISLYQSFPTKIASTLKEKADKKVQALSQEAEAKISEIAKKVEALSTDAEPAEGLKALAEAEKITYTPTKQIVASLKKKLTEDLANEADLKQKKAELAANKRLSELLQKFDHALLESHDLKAAGEAAAEAKKDPALAPAENIVKAMNEVVAAYDDASHFDQETLNKLVGQKVELETNGGAQKGTVAKVQEGTIYLKIELGGVVAQKPVKISDLTDAQRKKLFPPFVPQTDAQRVAMAYTKLAKDAHEPAVAIEQLNQAADFPLTPHCREIADKLRVDKEKQLLEAAAPATWLDIQSRANAAKLSETEMKSLSERLVKFEREYASTQFVANMKDKIAALKAKLGAHGPNLVVNGDFEKGTFDGWEKKGGTQSGEVVADQAHTGRFAMLANIQPDYNTTLTQSIAVEPQAEYRLSCWVKWLKGSLDNAARSSVYILDGSDERRADESHSLPILTSARLGEWVQLETKFTATNPTVKVEVFLRQRKAATERYFMLVDDIEVTRISRDKSTSPLPPFAVPDILKNAGLVFWVSPNADPAGTSRELLNNTLSSEKGTVTIGPDSGLKVLKFDKSYVLYPATEAVKSLSAGSAFVWVKTEKLPETFEGMMTRGDTIAGNGGHCDFSLFWKQDKCMMWFNFPENQWPGVDGKTCFYTKRPLQAGKWYMLGCTWDGKTVTMWVNGERDNTYQSTATPLKRSFAEILSLGCDVAGSPEYFNGLMMGAMVYNRALNDVEIKLLYASSGALGK